MDEKEPIRKKRTSKNGCFSLKRLKWEDFGRNGLYLSWLTQTADFVGVNGKT
jgi:hypothetical protein